MSHAGVGAASGNAGFAQQSNSLANSVDRASVVQTMKPKQKLSGLSDSSSGRTAFQGVSSPVTNILTSTDRYTLLRATVYS